MADFDVLPPGSFCWPELSTTDQKAGTAFYRALFGWDVDEQPIGPTETYSMFKLRGREVAAAAGQRAEERQHGVPSHWNAYISVKSADDAAKRAQELGGTVMAPPFDVMDAGRMAVVQDPTGAVFQVWQANRHIGTRVQGEPGALCWTELATRDVKKAETFYTRLFGWTPKTGGEYTELSLNGVGIGGIMPMPAQVPAQVPAHWTPYFQVTDVNAAAAKGKELGGSLIVPPTDIADAGRFAMLRDPQGAIFAVFAPKGR